MLGCSSSHAAKMSATEICSAPATQRRAPPRSHTPSNSSRHLTIVFSAAATFLSSIFLVIMGCSHRLMKYWAHIILPQLKCSCYAEIIIKSVHITNVPRTWC